MESILIIFLFGVFVLSLFVGLFVRYIRAQRALDEQRKQAYKNSQEFKKTRDTFIQSIKNKKGE